MSFRHMPAILVAALLSLAASFTPSSAALMHTFECDAGDFKCFGEIDLVDDGGVFEVFGLDFNALLFPISGSPSFVSVPLPLIGFSTIDPWALDRGAFEALFSPFAVSFEITGPNALTIEVRNLNQTGDVIFRSTAILTPIHDVPEPAIILLFGAGLAGLGFAARQKSKPAA